MDFIDPRKVLGEAGLRTGEVVADLGSGVGHFSIVAGEIVGAGGRVYAVEVQRDLLAKLASQAKSDGIRNIEVIWGDLDHVNGTRLKGGTVDFAIVANVLFQIEEHNNFAKEVKRVLKPGGRALVLDWSDSFSGMGPSHDNVVSKERAVEMFSSVGLHKGQEMLVGSQHYAFMLTS